MTRPQLLIVDDEAPVLAALQRSLRRHFGAGLEVHTRVDAGAALALLRVRAFDVVLSDLRMPAMHGLEFLRRAAGLRPHLVRLVLSGSADFATAQRAINESGVFRYLCKPWQEDDLARHVGAALALAAQERQQREAAQAWLDQRALPSAQELEQRRLEALEPGLTHVEWGPAGEVLMPPATGFGPLEPGGARSG